MGWVAAVADSVWAQGEAAVLPYAPELFPPHLSGAVCGFSITGDTLYFVREDSGAQRLVLYQALRARGKWTKVQPLPFSGVYNDQGARLTPDGKRMYFTSDRPGGSTRADDAWNLWYVDRTTTGWGDPVPLTAINMGDECCPLPWANELLFSASREGRPAWWISIWNNQEEKESFVDGLNQQQAWQWPSSFSRDGEVLLLNSMGRADRSFQDDVYVSWRTPSGFTEPHNLGAPVNTTAYEDGAILTPDEAWLIFCRHETAQTPSQVLCVPWPPIREKLKRSP